MAHLSQSYIATRVHIFSSNDGIHQIIKHFLLEGEKIPHESHQQRPISMKPHYLPGYWLHRTYYCSPSNQ
jgi:hypothetical protein